MANLPTTIGIADRLKAACKQQGIDRPGAWLARKIGVSAPSVSEWLSGQSVPTPDKAWVLARLLGVSFGWLYFGEVSNDAKASGVADAPNPYSSAVEVPVYSAHAGAGPGISNHNGQQVGSILFRPRSLQRRHVPVDHARVFYVMGNSMLPRLRDGDAVLFDTTDTNPVDGKVYVVHWNGKDYVKRLRFERASWWLCSDNTSEPEWSQAKQVRIAPDDCTILGRVRWVGSWED